MKTRTPRGALAARRSPSPASAVPSTGPRFSTPKGRRGTRWSRTPPRGSPTCTGSTRSPGCASGGERGRGFPRATSGSSRREATTTTRAAGTLNFPRVPREGTSRGRNANRRGDWSGGTDANRLGGTCSTSSWRTSEGASGWARATRRAVRLRAGMGFDAVRLRGGWATRRAVTPRRGVVHRRVQTSGQGARGGPRRGRRRATRVGRRVRLEVLTLRYIVTISIRPLMNPVPPAYRP